MGRLRERQRGTEPAGPVAVAAAPQPEIGGEGGDLLQLQGLIGNEGMAELAAGRAPQGVLAGFGYPVDPPSTGALIQRSITDEMTGSAEAAAVGGAAGLADPAGAALASGAAGAEKGAAMADGMSAAETGDLHAAEHAATLGPAGPALGGAAGEPSLSELGPGGGGAAGAASAAAGAEGLSGVTLGGDAAGAGAAGAAGGAGGGAATLGGAGGAAGGLGGPAAAGAAEAPLPAVRLGRARPAVRPMFLAAQVAPVARGRCRWG